MWDLKSGQTFTVDDQTAAGLTDVYLCTEMQHFCFWDDSLSRYMYCNGFEAIPVETEYAPPLRSPIPKITGTMSAVVTDTTDPESMNRVKVKLGTEQTFEIWARVSNPPWLAGILHSTPDIEDEVAVAFMSGDPSQPVVVGKLYNGTDAVPAQHAITVQRSGNSDFANVTIQAGDSLTLNTPGILAVQSGSASIDVDQNIAIQSGTDIEAIAGANAKIRSSLNFDLECTGIMRQKGSVIHLNGNAAQAARVGDVVDTGTIITGSSSVLIGD